MRMYASEPRYMQVKKCTRLLFPIVKLVSRGITFPQISLGPDTSLLERLCKVITALVDLGSLLVSRLSSDTAGNDNNLDTGDTRGKDQTLVVSVNHDHHTDSSGRET